jgi:hypothetical protein
MIKYEEKTVKRTEDVAVSYECDMCGKIVDSEYLPEGWILMEHSHRAWGNDSCESVEERQICSFKCMRETMIHSRKVYGHKYGYELKISEIDAKFIDNFSRED